MFLKKVFVFLIVCFTFFIGTNVEAQESACRANGTVVGIFRNSDGDFIGDISFEVYTQIYDVDGSPKPGTRLGSGRTSSLLGSGEATIPAKNLPLSVAAIKVYDKNSTAGAFWYYEQNIGLDCGGNVTFETVLSGMYLVLRNTEGELVKNQNFQIYSQRYDVDNSPIKEKSDLVGTLNTSNEGDAVLYIANKVLSIDREGPSYYAFESKMNGGTFTTFDNRIREERMTELEYVFSDMKINLKDQNNIAFPASTKIEIFREDYDVSGNRILGTKINTISTNDNGDAVFIYPEGYYVARIMGANKQYQEFWNLSIVDQERQNYFLKSGSTWDPGTGACSETSAVNLTVTDLEGNHVSGLKFEIYEEVVDVNGIPDYGTKLATGVIDAYGEGFVAVKPDPRKKYVLKVYEKNSKVGEYWFYDGIQFVCGKDFEIQKYLSSLKVVLRDGDGNLKKNQKFSIYTQKYDNDRTKIKEKKDLVGSYTTSELGAVSIFLAPDHPFVDTKKGTYVFVGMGENRRNYEVYDIKISIIRETEFDYTFSDLLLDVVTPKGEIVKDKKISFYKQDRNLGGELILGNLIKTYTTDSSGKVKFEYPSGYYAAVYLDDLSKKEIIWDVQIRDAKRNLKTLTQNSTRVVIKDSKGVSKPKDTLYSVYSMKKNEDGLYYKNVKVKSFKIEETFYDEIVLAEGVYLLTMLEDKVEFGRAFYMQQDKFKEVIININKAGKIVSGQTFQIEIPKPDQSMADRLLGNILLQVEEKGEAWYVNPNDKKRYYMKDGEVAYEMMRKFGLGITTENLSKIPIGIDRRFVERDVDQDGLPDKMEEALGTNMYEKDTDFDGYIDGAEVEGGYNPNGPGKLSLDLRTGNALKGKIVLQVESRGEAWYINPSDGKRYYMKDGESAYAIMRYLSLGITNYDLEKISINHLEG